MTMLETRLREAGHAEAMPSSPDPEVPEQPKRRRFSAAYKARVLAEADACSERGQIGSLLRREGLYSSHLSAWRKQRDQGAPRAPGRAASSVLFEAPGAGHRAQRVMVLGYHQAAGAGQMDQLPPLRDPGRV